MFLDNRYARIYNSIVVRAQKRGLCKRVLTGYFEKHHVVPKSLGGSDLNENLVLLTAREHFLCHMLLIRMTEGWRQEKMRRAFACMVFLPNSDLKRSSRSFMTARAIRKELTEFSSNARIARTKDMAKSFVVCSPLGEQTTVVNLKDWCRLNDFNYHTAHNNIRHPHPINRGALKGFKFKACI